MTITKAQKDMRQAYFGGGTGAIASGFVWLIAGLLALYLPQKTVLIGFLIGGSLIFPLGIIIDKIFGRSGKHKKGNPLGQLALETTFMMMLGILIALAVYSQNPLWFFPCMLLIIGARYLMFASIYGMKLYWVFGGVLAIAGYLVYAKGLPFHMGALMGGVIELFFAPLLMIASHQMDKGSD